MTKIPLTAVVLAHNEQDNLNDCLKSIDFCNEIIVIDSYSTDDTLKIANSFNCKTYQRDLDNDFSAQRNFAISKAQNEWIFMIDADERVTDKLKAEIINAVEKNEDACYKISRENHFVQGKALHGVLRPDNVERLFKASTSHYEGRIHERVHSTSPSKKLNGRLIHFTYKSWSAHLAKMNTYTDLLAQKYYEKGKKCNFVRDILIKPFWAFIKMYIIHLGFLDGKLGLEFSLLHATYTLEKYLKLDSLNKYKGRI